MPADPARPGGIGGVDHVALPLEDAGAMITFYRALGLEVTETPYLVQVHLGTQMINFHRPELYLVGFTLRAAAATPPCGDLCLTWDGSIGELQDLLGRTGTEIVEGPVEREGGRGTTGTSVYVRDPDGNLLEFLTYPDAPGST